MLRLLDELGLIATLGSSLDVKLLCAQRFVRLFAYGSSTLILVSYLSSLDIPDDRIGLFMTLTLAGDVVISFFLTLVADSMGRRAVLALGSALMVISGVIFALFENFWILMAAAIFGVISPRYVSSKTSLCFPRNCCSIGVVGMKLGRFAPWKSRQSLTSRRMNCSAMFSFGTP